MELKPSLAGVRPAVAVAGGAALLAQIILLREILASSQGNELVLGVVMAAWLGLTGLLSALGARFAGPPPVARRRLGGLLVLAPALLSASLWLVHLAPTDPLGGAPGLLRLLAASFASLLPACAIGGLAFAWAAAARDQGDEGLGVYIAETVGAALAGVLFHFFFAEHLAAVWVLLLAGSLAAAAGVVLLWRRWVWVILAPAVTLLALALAPAVDLALAAARFPGQAVLALQPSRYGLAAVVERGDQRIFFHDGVLLFTTEDRAAGEETVHLPMLLHPRPRRVLFIGGGLGGGIVQVLAHRPEAVDYAEMDPVLLGLAARYADPDTRAALADPRVHLIHGDPRALLRRSAGRYDVILLSLPIAQNALAARLSTRESLEDARQALAPGGLLAVVTPGSDTYLDPAARQRHASLWASLARVFPAVAVAPGSETILWASASAVDARPGILAARLEERGLRPVQIGRTWLYDRLLSLHAQGYRRSLATTSAVENRDARPVVYLFGLVENLERVSPKLGRALLGFVAWPWAKGALVVGVLGLAMLALWLRHGRGAPGFAVAAAGAAGMTLEMLLLLAFQALVGHLYHGLGALLACFMVGLAAGAYLARRWLVWGRALPFAMVVGAASAALLPATLALARILPGAGAPLVFASMMIVGASTGAVYPLAVRAAGHARAVAQIYAWDLAGAAGAALVVSLLAVPLLGLLPVAGLAAALCLAAALANRQ